VTDGPAIELRGVSLAFGATPALEEVDLTVPRGEFLGVIGPNGGGKTVLLKVMLGLLRPDRGTVRVLGVEPRRARGRVAYVPQSVTFEAGFPVRVVDVVLMGRLPHRPLLRRFTAADRERARAALAEVGLAGREARPVAGLSGGERQRVLLARALAMEAPLLLLDEPEAGLDPEGGRSLAEILHRLRPAATVVLVSHDVELITAHMERVVCLDRRLHERPAECRR